MTAPGGGGLGSRRPRTSSSLSPPISPMVPPRTSSSHSSIPPGGMGSPAMSVPGGQASGGLHSSTAVFGLSTHGVGGLHSSTAVFGLSTHGVGGLHSST